MGPDKIVTDPDETVTADDPPDEPAIDRAPTKPMPFAKGARIEIDLADAQSAAEFLELVGRILRDRGRIIITVE